MSSLATKFVLSFIYRKKKQEKSKLSFQIVGTKLVKRKRVTKYTQTLENWIDVLIGIDNFKVRVESLLQWSTITFPFFCCCCSICSLYIFFAFVLLSLSLSLFFSFRFKVLFDNGVEGIYKPSLDNAWLVNVSYVDTCLNPHHKNALSIRVSNWILSIVDNPPSPQAHTHTQETYLIQLIFDNDIFFSRQ